MRWLFAGSPKKYFNSKLICAEELAQERLLANFRQSGSAKAIELDWWLLDRDTLPGGWRNEL